MKKKNKIFVSSICLIFLVVIVLVVEIELKRDDEKLTAQATQPVIKSVKDPLEERYLKWMYNNSKMPRDILKKIYDVVKQYPQMDIILAIICEESKFNPLAVSKKGAIGLMQVMKVVWLDELKKKGIVKDARDLFLIDKNIQAGSYIFLKYLKQTKDLKKALYKYCGGNRVYVERVLRALGDIYLLKGTIGG